MKHAVLGDGLFNLWLNLIVLLLSSVIFLLPSRSRCTNVVGIWDIEERGNMLIETYDLEVFTPPCEPGAERFAAKARLKADISDALPYLNATLRGAIYYPAAKALTWKKGRHNIAFHPFEVAISNMEDKDEAVKQLNGLIELINRTWERRAAITPSKQTRQRPTPMAVYKLLPGSNCKLCGEPTCWIFAAKIATSHKKLAACPPLSEAQYAENLAALEEIAIEAPAIG
jgi:ArsR family metal-binding transcriptional regulator